jgi:hypothetical protein
MAQEKKVPEKRPYSSPTLWVHGGIGELTQAAGLKAGVHADTRGKAMDLRTV